MPDYRALFDNDWLRSWDLQGRSWVMTIVRVEAGLLENHKARKKDKKPILHFKGAKKPLALNRTNAKAVAAIYGNDTDKWIGKPVELYPTTTQFGNETMDCIRIRPNAPTGKAVAALPEAPPPPEEREVGQEG